MLGAVSDDVLSLDCDMIVDELVIRDVDVTDVVGHWDETEELLGFTEENEMTVLRTFTLDFWYWEYVAVPMWVDLNGNGIANKQKQLY